MWEANLASGNASTLSSSGSQVPQSVAEMTRISIGTAEFDGEDASCPTAPPGSRSNAVRSRPSPSRAAQEGEPGHLEVVVEREGGRDALLAHELEAHRIHEGERLVREPERPVLDRVPDQVGGDLPPVVDRIPEEPCHGGVRLSRTPQVEQVGVELPQDQGRPEEASARVPMRPCAGHRLGVMLIV
jgi:hypothetical protein